MFFSPLKRAIQAQDEKGFYDIALLYLRAIGYKDLSIVDGPRDGGRDVTCSREELHIQLSVRKDWAAKINAESTLTKKKGRNSFIYVTNRKISPEEKAEFLTIKHKNHGDVAVTIYDLNDVATTLSQPGLIRKAYELLGMEVPKELHASPQDIALSTVLLFSSEAKELRVNLVEANITAWLSKNAPAPTTRVTAKVASLLHEQIAYDEIGQSIRRMQSDGRIVSSSDQLSLSKAEIEKAFAAEENYLQSLSGDLKILEHKYGLQTDDARRLLNLALELTVRGRHLEEHSSYAAALSAFIAEKRLVKRKAELYEDLAKTHVAKFDQYGKAIDRILSTNTFDIYRALGRQTDITIMLDASVAMPMLCGLAFGDVKSRFGMAAQKLRELCEKHNFKIVVPSFYINEMASHGRNTADFVAIYQNLPNEARDALVGSGNAYLHHYAKMKSTMTAAGASLPTLEEFLKFFGIEEKRDIRTIENKLESRLNLFGIGTLRYSRFDQEWRLWRQQVADKKDALTSSHIIDHDAMTLALLHSADSGYIFASWDYTLIDMVADINRVYADTPARVIDFLSMAKGADYECDQSIDLLTSLIHIDDAKATALAEKIQRIHSPEQAFRLGLFIDDARARGGSEWRLTDHEADIFFQQDAMAVRE